MRTDEYAILLQGCQVPPHRGGGNSESGTEVGSGNSTLTGKNLSNAKSTLFREHEVYALLVPVSSSFRCRSMSRSTNCIALWTNCIVQRFPFERNRAITNKIVDKRSHCRYIRATIAASCKSVQGNWGDSGVSGLTVWIERTPRRVQLARKFYFPGLYWEAVGPIHNPVRQEELR
jgi:hypothetical protein